MREFTVSEITRAVCGKLLCGSGDGRVYKICTDSRKAEAGDLFFPLIGEKNDGHDYLEQVLERGCRTIIVSDESKLPGSAFLADGMQPDVISVRDTTEALQSLAEYYLSTLPLKHKIAVTGSVGKTSTRDIMYYVAATKYKTGRNIKNFNNWFGLPLSILEFAPDTEIAVLEMGMDKLGQIEALAKIVKPDIALITNIGVSHIENLGSREGILKAKLEVSTFFDEKSTLIVNDDCDLLKKEYVSGKYRLTSVGTNQACEYCISDVCDFGDRGIKFALKHKDKTYNVGLDIPGAHNATNTALALAAGELMGIDIEKAIEGLAAVKLTEKRLNVSEKAGIKIIDDSYNAAPASMMSAINTLVQTEGKRRIAILGDMYELGSRSETEHRSIGEYAGKKKLDLLIAVGDFAAWYRDGAMQYMPPERILYFKDKKELIERINALLRPGDTVLVKASRGMRMEEIINEILGD